MSRNELIHEVLLALNINPSKVAYYYITDALNIILDNPVIQDMRIYKDVYYTVAKKYNVSMPGIEKSMREAEVHAYKTADKDLLKRIFGNSVVINTGKHFLFPLAMYIKMRGGDSNE